MVIKTSVWGVVHCVWCRRNVDGKNSQEICLVHKKGLCSQTKTLEVTLLACEKIALNSLEYFSSISVCAEDSDPADLLCREGGPACQSGRARTHWCGLQGNHEGDRGAEFSKLARPSPFSELGFRKGEVGEIKENSLRLLSAEDSGKNWPHSSPRSAPTSASRPRCGHMMAMATRDHEIYLLKLPSITVSHICWAKSYRYSRGRGEGGNTGWMAGSRPGLRIPSRAGWLYLAAEQYQALTNLRGKGQSLGYSCPNQPCCPQWPSPGTVP